MLRSTVTPICSRAAHNTLLLFHTSATVADKKKTKSSSRRRLTEDLQAKSKYGASNLEVAPSNNDVNRKKSWSKPTRHTFSRGGRKVAAPSLPLPKREFSREPLPHQGLDSVPRKDENKSGSFRRGRRNEMTGNWSHLERKSRPFRDGYREDVHYHTLKGRHSARRNPESDNALGDLTRSCISQGQKDLDQVRARKQVQRESLRRIENSFEAAGRPPPPSIRQGREDLDQVRNRQHARTESPGRMTKSFSAVNAISPPIPELSDANTTRPNSAELATRFRSPPLMPGILSCLEEALGPDPSPTPIQALSLKWLLNDASQPDAKSDGWKQFLLASETGSGKSIAYLLPVLQNLKLSELNAASSPPPPTHSLPNGPKRPLNPRALILAPTHELSRQLSSFAKSLLHEVKLRVLCASRANVKNTKERDATARQMASQLEMDSGEFEIKSRSGFPVDVVVGTPMKLLELVKGRGWDRKETDGEDPGEKPDDEHVPKSRRGRDKMVGFGTWRSKPEMGLANVEWVVVDEADVLFDQDFQETTRQLLADISAARGHPIPVITASSVSQSSSTTVDSTPIPYNYPFNFILTSATIPASLANYLDTHHPELMRLASPGLHHLPKALGTEYVSWSGGNKFADIERRIRRVWAEDSSTLRANGTAQHLSKVLIFCNKSAKVEELGAYLEEQGIKNIALSSTSEHRKRGSNHHLDGFLRVRDKDSKDDASDETEPTSDAVVSDPKTEPHILITTSLLSRGLDFTPSIRHVFIVDEPRNTIDFLHRAGRTGRAGERGRVVVFGKMKGRGSSRAKDVRKIVGSLVAH